MQRRIGVVIHADDPVVHCGVTGLLRHRPELSLLAGQYPQGGSVLVLCVDSVEDKARALIRESTRPAHYFRLSYPVTCWTRQPNLPDNL
jgi:hypothetical protein